MNPLFITIAMLGDIPIADPELTTLEELTVIADDYNYCVHHPDAWYEVFSIDNKPLNILDYISK